MKLIDWFISLSIVQKRLKELGWMPPAPKAVVRSGGPSAPPPPVPPPPPTDGRPM